MSAPRPPWFFLPPGTPIPPAACLPDLTVTAADWVHRLSRVHRMRPGDPLVVVDTACETAYRGVVSHLQKTGVVLRELTRLETSSDTGPEIVAAVCLLKGAKWDGVLQKLTELGVHRIQPLISDYTVVDPRDPAHKHVRWQEILRHAAEQSEQARVPVLSPMQEVPRFLAEVPREETVLRLLALERCDVPIHRYFPRKNAADAIYFAIGPEGGWTASEQAAFEAAGFLPVGLGATILRSETAALAMASLLRYGG